MPSTLSGRDSDQAQQSDPAERGQRQRVAMLPVEGGVWNRVEHRGEWPGEPYPAAQHKGQRDPNLEPHSTSCARPHQQVLGEGEG